MTDSGNSGLVRLEWEGKNYSLDIQSVTAREYRIIKQHTGLNQGAFMGALSGNLAALDGDALIALMWLARKRAGENNDIADFDDLPVLAIAEGLKLPEEPKEKAPKALKS